MLLRQHEKLSLSQQCKILGLSRSSIYYQKRPIKNEDLELMRLIDEQYLKRPVWGSRSMTTFLRRQGWKINRKRVQRLMRTMGLEAVYPRPKTSKANPEHKIYPYLLRDLIIDRPNQVWATDITYVPMHRGFMYLVAIMDWHSRKVLSWRVSNTMDTDFCVEALEDAIRIHGRPEIFNTDQGSQFTSNIFTGKLEEYGVKISMDGRGRYQDNIFVERLWWTVKYHFLYLHAFNSGAELRYGLKNWFNFYNQERFHQSLGDKTPDEVYYDRTISEAVNF